MKKIIAFSVMLLTIVTACTTKQGVTTKSDNAYQTLTQNEYGGRETKSHEVITTSAALATLYKELNIEQVPSVDFDKYNVVALFLGQKNSGGYKIGIKSVTVDGNTATVNTEETKPSGMSTMAITNPYNIVKIVKIKNVVVK